MCRCLVDGDSDDGVKRSANAACDLHVIKFSALHTSPMNENARVVFQPMLRQNINCREEIL